MVSLEFISKINYVLKLCKLCDYQFLKEKYVPRKSQRFPKL
jgi:hypothetical protein